jgi:hypothetical protein
MADRIVRQTVIVWGERYELTVHQRSKSVWIARGDFDGEPLEGKGRSPSAAAGNWREQARYKSN